MISAEFARKYEAFLKRYFEPDLRHCNATEAELQQHIDGMEASSKGAAVRLGEAIAALGQALKQAVRGFRNA